MIKNYSLLLFFVVVFITQSVSADICLPDGPGNECTAGDSP